MASRTLRFANNRPDALKDDFQWLANLQYQGNLLIFIDTHSDTATGNLVASGNAQNPGSLPLFEVCHRYFKSKP